MSKTNNIYYIQKTTDSLESYLKELPINSSLPFSTKNGILNSSYEIGKYSDSDEEFTHYLVYSFVDDSQSEQMNFKELLKYLKEIIGHTTLIFEK
tara:strand:- start:5605 stop:5889 length:285 start_codon:yes stop_codon:yes gene_type:complete